MILDKKGNLFGKVNIIDLCVVIVIVAAGFFVAGKLGGSAPGVSAQTERYQMKFFVEEAPEFVANSVEVGGTVEDELKNIYLGTITDVKIDKGFMFFQDAEGQVQKSYKEGYNSVEITTELDAQAFANGIIVEGNKYTTGHTFTIRAGHAKIYLKISDISKVGE